MILAREKEIWVLVNISNIVLGMYEYWMLYYDFIILLWSEWWFYWFTNCSGETLIRNCWQAVEHYLSANLIDIGVLTW
jgi:hypothetical protein